VDVVLRVHREIVIFAFLFFVGEKKVRWAIYPVLLLVSGFFSLYFLPFILGLLICDIYHHYDLTTLMRKVSFFLVGMIILLSLPVAGYALPEHVVGATCILLMVLYSGLLQRFCQRFYWLGKVSYALYAIHYLIIVSVLIMFNSLLHHIIGDLSLAIVFVIAAPLCIVVAYVLMVFVDEPGIRLSKKLYKLVRGQMELVRGRMAQKG
jgi:peptidoglycan/LPS O-acetylase OafA/YrhL